MDEDKLLELAKQWVLNRNYANELEILPFQTSMGLVIFFYDAVTWADVFMMTVPMVKELIEGKNPKKIKNNYK